MFRCAGNEVKDVTAAENAVVFTEVSKPAKAPRMPAVLEIALPSGHLVRACRRELIATRSSGYFDPQREHADAAGVGAGLRGAQCDGPAPVIQSAERASAEVLGQDPLSGHVFVFFNRHRNRARELYLLLEGIEVVRGRRRYIRLPANV